MMDRASQIRPTASLSLDLDNQWSYMKTHGDAGWQSFPSYLDVVVPRILDVCRKLQLSITVFIVGQDAALPKNRDALASIAAAGHEIGNHSFHHEPWLHLYSAAEIEREIADAEAAIADATGQIPRGFRGPGFSVSGDVLETLKRRGYLYDASTFPTFLGPVARAYYFFNAKLTADEKAERRLLFGSMSDGLRPLTPYNWSLTSGSLLEIPVTTMPILRAPFHLSYILYLASLSPQLAHTYFTASLKLCRATGVAPSLLLHPLDFLSGDDINALKFFPAMQIPAAQKLDVVTRALEQFCAMFEVVAMGEHARRIQSDGGPSSHRLSARAPNFTTSQAGSRTRGTSGQVAS
jgi:peptidoglycan-N-acetylglucosamine deacetylase